MISNCCGPASLSDGGTPTTLVTAACSLPRFIPPPSLILICFPHPACPANRPGHEEWPQNGNHALSFVTSSDFPVTPYLVTSSPPTQLMHPGMMDGLTSSTDAAVQAHDFLVKSTGLILTAGVVSLGQVRGRGGRGSLGQVRGREDANSPWPDIPA